MSKTLEELRSNAAKGIETCWVVERRVCETTKYLAWCSELGVTWKEDWDRALKLYDRASCETLCVDMPDYWDVSILEHQMVFPLPEPKTEKDNHVFLLPRAYMPGFNTQTQYRHRGMWFYAECLNEAMRLLGVSLEQFMTDEQCVKGVCSKATWLYDDRSPERFKSPYPVTCENHVLLELLVRVSDPDEPMPSPIQCRINMEMHKWSKCDAAAAANTIEQIARSWTAEKMPQPSTSRLNDDLTTIAALALHGLKWLQENKRA